MFDRRGRKIHANRRVRQQPQVDFGSASRVEQDFFRFSLLVGWEA